MLHQHSLEHRYETTMCMPKEGTYWIDMVDSWVRISLSHSPLLLLLTQRTHNSSNLQFSGRWMAFKLNRTTKSWNEWSCCGLYVVFQCSSHEARDIKSPHFFLRCHEIDIISIRESTLFLGCTIDTVAHCRSTWMSNTNSQTQVHSITGGKDYVHLKLERPLLILLQLYVVFERLCSSFRHWCSSFRYCI